MVVLPEYILDRRMLRYICLVLRFKCRLPGPNGGAYLCRSFWTGTTTQVVDLVVISGYRWSLTEPLRQNLRDCNLTIVLRCEHHGNVRVGIRGISMFAIVNSLTVWT